MLIPHMAVASIVEGMMTALIVLYLQRSSVKILEAAGTSGNSGEVARLRKLRWLWVGLAVLAVASPFGLLAKGSAWGEWSVEELTKHGLQSIPAGLEKLSTLWGAPLAEYNVPVFGNANAGYILSALLGIVLVGMLVWLLTFVATSGSGKQKQSI